MFCNQCGKEIENDSRFCRHCGAEQASEPTLLNDGQAIDPTPQKTDKAPDGEESKGGCITAICWMVVIVTVVALIFAVLANISSERGGSSSGSSGSPGSSGSIFSDTRAARSDDITVRITTIPGIFEPDTYYVEIQAQEKITGLKVDITFVNSSGRTIKTESINVGKAVPGNKYTYELDQSGVDADDIDTMKKFSWRVTAGTVEED